MRHRHRGAPRFPDRQVGQSIHHMIHSGQIGPTGAVELHNSVSHPVVIEGQSDGSSGLDRLKQTPLATM
jgi:hypothetical protein